MVQYDTVFIIVFKTCFVEYIISQEIYYKYIFVIGIISRDINYVRLIISHYNILEIKNKLLVLLIKAFI